MSKEIIAFFILLLSISIIATNYAQAQSLPHDQEISVSNAKAFSENNAFKILGIDSTAFPNITVNIYIDKFCALTGNLEKENFKVKEESSDIAIDNFYFTGNASGHKLDLAIVFDTSGSMDNEIKALQLKVQDLINKINSSKLDARYSLITIKADVEATKVKWTRDTGYFIDAIGKLSASGGDSGPENSIGAIETMLSSGFRPDTQKVILVITDEPSHQKGDGYYNSTYTMEGANKNLSTSGVILIAVSPDFRNPSVDPGVPRSDLPKYADMRMIANEIGLWIDINSADFSTILDQFKGILTGTYVIEYTSPDQTLGKNRTVLVAVNVPGCVTGSDSTAYTSPGSAAGPNSPPTIDDLTADKTSPQDAGMTINWTANAIDPDGDLVLYKFFLDGRSMTPWAEDKTWMWVAGEAGSYRIEVQVRDAKHAGPNEQDDLRAESFTVNESKPTAPENQPPTINDLLAVQGNATEITWTANATDPENDPLLHRFILNNKTVTNWIKENKWTLNTPEADVGNNSIEVQIRDGKHKGSDGYDDAKIVHFKLSSMKLMVQTWEKTFGGSNAQAYSVLQTSDGGYIVVGGTKTGTYEETSYGLLQGAKSRTLTGPPGAGGFDVWLIKTDASGNKLWDKTFGGPKDDIGYSVLQTSDGGYILVGTTNQHVTGEENIWLIKTDANGNKLWDKTFGSGNSEGYSIQQTTDGGYILVGSTVIVPENTYGTFYPDVWLIKTDSQGNDVWDKTFGGSNTEIGRSVEQTSDGGYVIVGDWSQEHTSDFRFRSDAWLIKTDSQGIEEWDRTFGEQGWDNGVTFEGQGFNSGISARQTSDGGYILVGNPRQASKDIWLIKTDPNGNMIWDKSFWGYAMEDSERSVQQTGDGGYIIIGNAELIKTNSLGSMQWNRTFTGLNNWGHSVQQTSDDGYVVAGTITKGDSADAWLIKTDANGNV